MTMKNVYKLHPHILEHIDKYILYLIQYILSQFVISNACQNVITRNTNSALSGLDVQDAQANMHSHLIFLS